MLKVKEFIKNEIVLILSFVLAVISAFFVAPNKGYLEYIDFRTLGLLFCLMAVMAGLNSMGVFKFKAAKLPFLQIRPRISSARCQHQEKRKQAMLRVR